MSNLRHLNLAGCTMVTDITLLGRMRFLEHLNLSDCYEVEDFTHFSAAAICAI